MKNYYDVGLERLADAVMKQAAEDYVGVLSELKENPNNKRVIREKEELEEFFSSKYCRNISKADPAKIVELCKTCI